METLEDFIEEYKPLVHMIYNAFYSNILDADDLSEMQYSGLWKVWESYDPTRKVGLNTYITRVIRNYAVDLIRKKNRRTRGEIPLGDYDDHYFDPVDYKECYTDEEWKILKPSYEGKTLLQIKKELGYNHQKYKKICQLIVKNRV